MAEQAVNKLLEGSQTTASAAERIDSAVTLIESLFNSGDIDGIVGILDYVFGANSNGMLLSRPIIRAVVACGESSTLLTSAQLQSLWKLALGHIARHTGVYEDYEIRIRLHFSNLLRNEGNFNEAASCLAERLTQDATPLKLDLLIQSVELFLIANNIKEAENLIPRAVTMSSECGDPPELQHRIKFLQARIADFTHQQLEAARRYLDLSRAYPDSPNLNEYFSSACACSILSPAGPKRNKIIASLLKQDAEAKHVELLQKILRGALVNSEELKSIEEMLQPHQRIPNSEGLTPIENSFRDHNIFAASQAFKTISFNSLAKLLRTTPEIAERTAEMMIKQGRLQQVVIDGENGFLRFSQKEWSALESSHCRLSDIFSRFDAVVASLR